LAISAIIEEDDEEIKEDADPLDDLEEIELEPFKKYES